jgi:selenocysteine-specific translation elongation factor
MHITIGVFGDQELAKKLGKKGTTNDIAIYNHGSSEGVFTYVCPNSDKIQPLLQSLNMIDLPVIVVNSLTKEIGETIIAIDEMKFKKGFIITKIKDEIQPLIKNTSLEKFEVIEEDNLWPTILELKIERKKDFLMIPIDNYFNVKGIGTVILGIIKSGKINLHDKVLVEPLEKEAVVKGIQSQDRDIEEADAGTRIGLNLKGIDVDELERGYVICKEKMEKSTELKVKFNKNKFFKQEIKPGMQVSLSVGLQVVTSTIESIGEEIRLKSNQKIAYLKDQSCIIASQNDILPRIIGSGSII